MIQREETLIEFDQNHVPCPTTDEPTYPILIGLLGSFLLLKKGTPVVVRSSGKIEALFCYLGVHYEQAVSRNVLLEALWPGSDSALACQSLSSLLYSVHKLLGDAIDGAAPVLHTEGYYQLNLQSGVYVDVERFDTLAKAGDQCLRTNDVAAAVASYSHAVDLYRSDLHFDADMSTLLRREHLRARYLTLLGHLAMYYYSVGDYTRCLQASWRVLDSDPCREDAHRLVMRCHVRQGERAEALRQYRVCVDILRAEFDAAPEPATTALFECIRLDPNSI